MTQTVRHGSWLIYYDPPPIPTRACDWHFVHDDYDGEDDHRNGSGPSVEDCLVQIAEIDAERAA